MPKKTLSGAKGTWEIEVKPNSPGKQDTIIIKFTPKHDSKGCSNIRLAQAVKSTGYDKNGNIIARNNKQIYKPGKNPFSHKEDDTVDNVYIDHLRCEGDPFYNGEDTPHDDPSKGDATKTPPDTTEMSDSPWRTIPDPDNNNKITKVVDEFETCAICVDTGKCLGCIKWKMVADKNDGSQISLVSTKEEKCSTAFKKAMKQFMQHHAKIDPTDKKVKWYCPDTKGTIKGPGGQTGKPYGGEIPEGFRKEWVEVAPKKTKVKKESKKIGMGKKMKDLRSAIAFSLETIDQSAIKFTWSGEQTKTTPSVIFTTEPDLEPEQIAPFVQLEERFANDFQAINVYWVSIDTMQQFLELASRLEEHDDPLEAPITVTIMGGLASDGAAYTFQAFQEQFFDYVAELASLEGAGTEVFDALQYLAANFGVR